MKWLFVYFPKLSFLSLYFLVICLTSFLPTFAQQAAYSTKAKDLLKNYSDDNFDVFKFKINDILNSAGDNINNSNGDPTIFGRTD